LFRSADDPSPPKTAIFLLPNFKSFPRRIGVSRSFKYVYFVPKKFSRTAVTPTLNWQNGRIDPKLIASWNEFATRDRSSRYHALISSLVTNVNEQKQTISQKDRPLFARFGMGDNFDQWWRFLQLRLTER
jgi:hypothetical protein